MTPVRHAIVVLCIVAGSALAAPSRALQRVAGASLAQSAQDLLLRELREISSAAEASLAAAVADRTLPAGKITLRAHRAAGVPLRTRNAIAVDIAVDGVPSGTAWVWFDAKAPVAGLRYARDLAPGSVLAAADLTPATVDRLRDPDALIADPEPALGLRLTARVAAGDVVAAAALEVAPLIARAERVRVLHRAGAVALETRGTARADGRLGDLIEVLVEGAESTCRARVIGQGVVDVVL